MVNPNKTGVSEGNFNSPAPHPLPLISAFNFYISIFKSSGRLIFQCLDIYLHKIFGKNVTCDNRKSLKVTKKQGFTFSLEN